MQQILEKARVVICEGVATYRHSKGWMRKHGFGHNQVIKLLSKGCNGSNVQQKYNDSSIWNEFSNVTRHKKVGCKGKGAWKGFKYVEVGSS